MDLGLQMLPNMVAEPGCDPRPGEEATGGKKSGKGVGNISDYPPGLEAGVRHRGMTGDFRGLEGGVRRRGMLEDLKGDCGNVGVGGVLRSWE